MPWRIMHCKADVVANMMRKESIHSLRNQAHQLLHLGSITTKQTHIIRHVKTKRFQAIL